MDKWWEITLSLVILIYLMPLALDSFFGVLLLVEDMHKEEDKRVFGVKMEFKKYFITALIPGVNFYMSLLIVFHALKAGIETFFKKLRGGD